MYLLKCRCNDLSTVINNTHHFCSFRRNQQRVRGHKFCGWQSQISQPSPGDVDATRWSRAGQILRVLQPDSQLKEFALCSARIPSESEQPKQFPAVIPSIYLYLFTLCSSKSEEKKIDLKKKEKLGVPYHRQVPTLHTNLLGTGIATTFLLFHTKGKVWEKSVVPIRSQ